MYSGASVTPNAIRKANGAEEARSRAVLVVDDEESVRSLLARWLEAAGHTVLTASGAETALEAIQQNAPAVVLCDIRMPGHDGLWLVGQIRERHPDTAVIMASGVNDVEASLECMRHGVLDYLTKPFGRDRLLDAVRRGIEWSLAASEGQRWRQALELEMAARREWLVGTVRSVVVDHDAAVDTLLALALSGRDAYAHAQRVRYLAVGIARQLGMAAEEVEVLARAALLHDIGKGALPDAVLRKPAPLTADEQLLVRRFPSIGADVLRDVPFLSEAAAIVGDAHERMDGHGYPRGVRAESVSLSARIVSVADAFDTITHPRVYRDPLPPREALDEIERCQGTHFDPAVVSALRGVLTQKPS